ncbi:hypothetical protein [Comamonas thiooxydans]|uniref:hypothetical protein n=1 Tax=Comamonas thiooxydans TaxID=363952 RepID=UPI00057AAA05|nr:hypothetical protein [Comamonas thiooxydans]
MKKNKLTHDELEAAFMQALRGMARLQARQEMMECVIRSLIAECEPMHPLIWKALHTAKSDLATRSSQARSMNPPETDADAMALWNVLLAACAPPQQSENGNSPS